MGGGIKMETERRGYRLESDPVMAINLNSPTEVLEGFQKQFQQKIAKFTMDLTVITEELVQRRVDN